MGLFSIAPTPHLASKGVGANPIGCDSAYCRQGDRLKYIRVSTISFFGKEHGFVVGGNMGGIMYEA